MEITKRLLIFLRTVGDLNMRLYLPEHFGVPVLVREGLLVVVGLDAVRVRGDEGGPSFDVFHVGPHLSDNTYDTEIEIQRDLSSHQLVIVALSFEKLLTCLISDHATKAIC